MSATIAIFIVMGVCGFSLIATFAIYKLRYIIWSGYFRAIFICEDGDIISVTRRLKSSDTFFEAKVKGIVSRYHIIQREPPIDQRDVEKIFTTPDKRAIDSETREKSKIQNAPGNSNSVVNERYSRIYRLGRFRLPVAYYNAHQAEPIDMQNLRKFSVVSAVRHRELARNTVTSQLLSHFSENPLKEAMAYILGVVVILGGILILGYYLNSRIDTIITKLGG